VAGTSTEIGKTWVSARLAEHLRAGCTSVAARKPVQSFEPGTGPTDADVLAAATGEHAHAVCPPHRWYEVAMAPLMAAEVLGRPPFSLDELVGEITWPTAPPVDVGLLETAGGVRSPMTSDGGDTVDVATAVGPDLIVLVADAGLGTINAVRLCLAPLDSFRVAVFLNRYDERDELCRRNREWLSSYTGARVVTEIPQLARAAVAR
jgi:dethiobiotin synthetase